MKRTTVKLGTDLVSALLLLSLVPLAIAQESPPAPRVVDDKNAPEGWKRYQFAYNGGDILSVVMPSAPQEYAGRGQVAADVLIRMMTRTFSANTRSASFNAFYADDLSVPAEKMTETQKNIFYEALWDGFANGMVKAFKEAGQSFETKTLEGRKIIVSGLEGVEQDFSVGRFRGRARIILSGQYAYMVLATWAPETPANQVEAFFKSFEVRKNK